MSSYVSLFRSLNDAEVQYIIVGGLATVLHGYPRLTADVDLIINLEQAEAENAVKAITAAGFVPRVPVDPLQFADKATREDWIKNKNMLVFSFYQPENPVLIIDIFVREPIPFRELTERAKQMDIGGVTVPVCAIEDLISLKKMASRPQDLQDIKYLQELLNLNDETES